MTDLPEEWRDYEDFAAGIDANRLPRSAALVGRTLAVELEDGRRVSLSFESAESVRLVEAELDPTGRCEVVEVASGTYFIGIARGAEPAVAEVLIVSETTRRVLSVRSRIRPAGEAPGQPRVIQHWVAGILAGGDPSGEVPAATRDLIGLRAFYTYSPNHVYEHVYLSSERYAWQNLRGVQRGHGDTDLATTYRFAPNQYVFGFREFLIPVASVFFYNFDSMRSTGTFLGETADGKARSTPAGAFIQKASMTFYPQGLEPV